MELSTLPLGPTTARVWTAGKGEAIVLLHGPWAGAEAYWFTVADELAVHDQLIAAFDWLHGIYGSTAIELAQTDGGRQSLDSVQVLPDARESSQDVIFHYRVA